MRTQEWPFNSDTKLMAVEAYPSSTSSSSTPRQLYVKGAIERILDRCTGYYKASHIVSVGSGGGRKESGIVVPLTAAEKKHYLNEASQMGCAGLRGGWHFQLV